MNKLQTLKDDYINVDDLERPLAEQIWQSYFDAKLDSNEHVVLDDGTLLVDSDLVEEHRSDYSICGTTADGRMVVIAECSFSQI